MSLRVGIGVIPVFFRRGGATGRDSPLFGGNGGLMSVCMKIACNLSRIYMQ